MDKLTEKIQKVYEEKLLNEKVSGYRLITSRVEKGKDPLGESITKYHKIQQVYESMLTEAKKVNLPKEVTKIVKKYGFDYDTSLADGQVDFFYIPQKRIPEGGEWGKIQIPYFMDLIEEGKQVTAWVAQYSGEELVDNSKQVIYNLKGLDTVMRRLKGNVDRAVTRNK